MSRRYYGRKSLEELIGGAITLPFKIALAAIFIALYTVLVVILWIPGMVYFFFAWKEGDIRTRAIRAIFWPIELLFSLLALNEFLSLGGLDNPVLSRVTGWLERRTRH